MSADETDFAHIIRPMTKFFTAGHSDSGDSYLPDGVLPWAERTRAWIEAASGTPCELQQVRFAPIGSRAVDYLLDQVARAAPDILVLPLGTYVFAVGTVEESIRARFGAQVQRLYRRSEAAFQRGTSDGQRRRRTNRAGRRIARTVIGTRAMATVEQTATIYVEILHRLAQIESLQVVAVADARFSLETQKRNPGLHDKVERMHAILLPVIEQHHFMLADLEGALRKAPDRSVFHHDDGVHTTAAFHETYFELLKETLAGSLRSASE